MKRIRAWHKAMIAIGALIASITIVFTIAARLREVGVCRTVCRAHLLGTWSAMTTYAEKEPNGAFPDDLAKLITADILTAKQFTCPSDRRGGRSYYYLSGYTMHSDPNQILIYEDPSVHGEGGTVLYLNGRTEFVDNPKFQQMIDSLMLPDGTPYAPHRR